LKELLLVLQELQTLDAKAHEVRQAKGALPEKLAPAKRDLARLEALLQAERNHIAETEKWRTEQEELVRREEEALRKAKSKLQETKNARDFAAASREIDNKRRSISEREEEVLKIIEALEATRRTMEAHDKDVETLRSHISTEEKEITEKVAELERQLSDHEQSRKRLTEKVPKQILGRYETVQRRRGIAVVPVVNGICLGCHMSLPPQLNNILARFETIESCPNCQRLLFRKELMGDVEGSGTPPEAGG
jgi:predicted  nucleic acid-binding Zn-ribbon protein